MVGLSLVSEMFKQSHKKFRTSGPEINKRLFINFIYPRGRMTASAGTPAYSCQVIRALLRRGIR